MLGGPLDMTIGEFARRLVPDVPLSEPVPKKKTEVTRRHLVMMAGVAIVLALGFWGISYNAKLAKARFSADYSKGTRRFIQIRCENRGDETLFWYVPWADGTPTTTDVLQNPMSAVGMLLYVQQKGNDTYQLVPDSPGCWWLDDTEIMPESRLAIMKGKIRTIVLDINKLKGLDLKVESLKIKFTRNGGRVLDTHETAIQ